MRLLTPHFWTLVKLQEDRSLVCFITSLHEELLTAAAAAAAALRIEPRAKGMHGVSARLQIHPHLSIFRQVLTQLSRLNLNLYLAQLGLELISLLSFKVQLLCRFLSNSFLAVLSHYNSRLEISHFCYQFQVGKLLRK